MGHLFEPRPVHGPGFERALGQQLLASRLEGDGGHLQERGLVAILHIDRLEGEDWQQVELAVGVDVGVRLLGDDRKVRGESAALDLRTQTVDGRHQVSGFQQSGESVVIPEEECRVPVGGPGEGERQGLAPVDHLCRLDPTLDLARGGGTHLDPVLALATLAAIDIKDRQGWQFRTLQYGPSRSGEQMRTRSGQHPLEESRFVGDRQGVPGGRRRLGHGQRQCQQQARR